MKTYLFMEFISTNRGARALIHEGYEYQINRRGRDGRISRDALNPELVVEHLQWGKSFLTEPINTVIQLIIQKIRL